MKRSKLFLGITSGLLAVVGIAAAKQLNSTISTVYYTAGSGCVSTPITPLSFHTDPAVGTDPITVAAFGSNYIAYKTHAGVQCTVPLYKNE